MWLGKLVAPKQEGPVWGLVARLGKLVAPQQEEPVWELVGRLGKLDTPTGRPVWKLFNFSENSFPKNLALKTAFYFFRKMLFRKISP